MAHRLRRRGPGPAGRPPHPRHQRQAPHRHLTADDLASWSATYEDPVTYDFDGWTVCKAGPWSQGPALLQQLALLPDELPPYGSGAYVHLLIENCKLAMADREAWYGDAAEVPLDDLLSAAYNAERRTLVGPRASHELRPGSPGGRTPRLAAHARVVADEPGAGLMGAGEPTVAKSPTSPVPGEPEVSADGATRGDTCHLDIVDRWGNMISATPSGGWLQSNPVVPELGFPLGTRLQMTWLEEGLPNSLTRAAAPTTLTRPRPARRRARHGVRHARRRPAGPVAAALLPRRRPARQGARWARPPGRHRRPELAQRQLPGSFYPRGMRPGSVTVESRTAPEVVEELRRRGHDVTVGDAWSEGRLCAVARDPATGILSAAANPRGQQGTRWGAERGRPACRADRRWAGWAGCAVACGRVRVGLPAGCGRAVGRVRGGPQACGAYHRPDGRWAGRPAAGGPSAGCAVGC